MNINRKHGGLICCDSVLSVLGLNFTFFVFFVRLCIIISLNHRKTKFEPGTKVNYNLHLYYLGGSITHESPTRSVCIIRVPLQIIN